MKWGVWIGTAALLSATTSCIEPLFRQVNSQHTTRTVFDSGVPVDVPSPPRDVRDEDTAPAAASSAGSPCTDDAMCGELTCDLAVRGGFCTGSCTNSTSQRYEQSQCGGSGSTCLSRGDGADASSRCAQACRTSNPSSCRAGFVCTGYWYSHAGATADAAGCAPFCTSDAHCLAGERCNLRTGECGTSVANEALLADGLPCTIPAMGAPSPCRGTCMQASETGTMGICGSFINVATTTACPDEPTLLQPLGRSGSDNLGLCVLRTCSATQCCPSGLVCEVQQVGDTEGLCVFDEPTLPNIGCEAETDAGAAGDGGTDAGDGE